MSSTIKLDASLPGKPAPAPVKPAPTLAAQELAPDEFYFEGPYMVFTAAYHTRRGYCCNSDCRHCPYRD